MTRDEVMAMTDGELNSMAWTMLYTEKPWRHWANADGTVTINGEQTSIADYATDISAAWQLVEYLDWIFSIEQDWHSGEYEAVFHLVDEDSGGNMRPYKWCDAKDKSVPSAITRAFILAMSTKSI